jgi:2-oxoglutarate ferredoxin oxidoreductase subunit beta
MGSQGTFFARIPDTEPQRMKEVFVEAAKHKGTSVVEILQNCVIFNNGIHYPITSKELKDDHQIYLEQGKPMIFGKNKNKGLMLEGTRLKVVTIGENGISEQDILIHNANSADDALHNMLVRMTLPEFPVATGVIRSFDDTVFEDVMEAQIKKAKEENKIKTVDDLINSGNVWEI